MSKNFFAILVVIILISMIVFIPHKQTRKKIIHPEFIEKPFGGKIKKEPKALPNEWSGYQRSYPYHTIKQTSYLNALDDAMEMHRKADNSRDYSWELSGPTNIGGRITDIEIHPNSPSTWYIGAASGGIYKTTNEGANWQNVFTDAPVISIGDIAIDPDNENIIYAGTGEANSSSQSFVGNGVYKSTDGGDSWEHSGLENSAYIGRIIVDYNDSQRIFAAATGTLFSPNAERGIYRSDDGGLTWDNKLFVTDSTAAIDLVQHPTYPNILYASMWERMRGRNYRRSGGYSSGIYKTTDGGDSWEELTNGLPDNEYVGRIGLAIAESNPDVLYAFYDQQPVYGYSFLGIFKTIDAGASWTQTNDGNIDDMNSSFGWYFGQIRVDPADENRVYALGVALCRTENGGDNWQVIADYGNTWEIHVDHHAMVIDEVTGRIVEGNDGGLYTSYDYGNNWEKINNLPLTQFYAIDVDYQLPERIYGGTQDNNTIRTNTGALDDWEAILGGDGFYCRVDHTNSNIIYAEYQYGQLHKSTNGGYNFNFIANQMDNDRTNWSSPLAMHPIDPEILYFGTYRVWKTENGGYYWEDMSGDITDGDDGTGYHTVTTININPTFPNMVIAGTDDGNVHVSNDNGENWTDVTAGLPDRWITRVAGDSFDENTIYVTVSGFRWDEPLPHVFKSTNLGQDWIDISSNLPELPINCIALDPEVYGRIFVGSDAGIFYTENGGDEWLSLSDGIPNVPIIDINIHNPSRTLTIGTYGCSSYKLDLNDITSSPQNNIPTSMAKLYQNYPNPFNPNTTISFSLQSSDARYAKIEIYNAKGQKVKSLDSAQFDGNGTYSTVWNGTDSNEKSVSSGVYLYRLLVKDQVVSAKKMNLIK
ncbi:MAG: T9SS type A sorting domain-containing protein [Candidatus Cloacimonetes bacterium]|nr:T9SS type A sorting domain-containing protein [Candidatus Cloacimonadota bacterium]MCF7813811.1 T9SS type A sorting domain-containing protein [Candidatus Cloacimonadota bacterium]MCF7868490.1 T9SS type A sorting domain-containing protein [Candidatus Cloacimonadota bacterium]